MKKTFKAILRMEQFDVQGTKIVLNLAKNPAGFNQNISAVMQDESMKDVIIVNAESRLSIQTFSTNRNVLIPLWLIMENLKM